LFSLSGPCVRFSCTSLVVSIKRGLTNIKAVDYGSAEGPLALQALAFAEQFPEVFSKFCGRLIVWQGITTRCLSAETQEHFLPGSLAGGNLLPHIGAIEQICPRDLFSAVTTQVHARKPTGAPVHIYEGQDDDIDVAA